jgi:hypothetical protein
VIVRYLPDGRLDSSFGSNGKAVAGFPPGSAHLNAVAIQPDGKIVAVGTRGPRFFGRAEVVDDDFALARFRPDGRLDS